MSPSDEEETKHHVAWADRVGLNKLWGEAIRACWATYGTDEFQERVEAFEMLIINIPKGPQLSNQVIEFKNNHLFERKKKILEQLDPNLSNEQYKDQSEQIEYDHKRILVTFMIQLLNDNNFIFYKSLIPSDDGGLDG